MSRLSWSMANGHEVHSQTERATEMWFSGVAHGSNRSWTSDLMLALGRGQNVIETLSFKTVREQILTHYLAFNLIWGDSWAHDPSTDSGQKLPL